MQEIFKYLSEQAWVQWIAQYDLEVMGSLVVLVGLYYWQHERINSVLRMIWPKMIGSTLLKRGLQLYECSTYIYKKGANEHTGYRVNLAEYVMKKGRRSIITKRKHKYIAALNQKNAERKYKRMVMINKVRQFILSQIKSEKSIWKMLFN